MKGAEYSMISWSSCELELELELNALGKGAGRERMRLLLARRRVRQILKHSEVVAVSLTQRLRSTPNRDERIEEK